jgi:NAD(P)-dependent dehydrogenase (short-subunit alcohol dehydrogenase family)
VSVVVVTGGSSGIGLATVRRLAAAGHEVFAAARNPTRNGLPDGVKPLVLDVGDPTAAAPAIQQVLDRAGRIDALVNNAGTGAVGAFEEVGDDAAHHIFEVNLFGPLRLAAAVIPAMRDQGGGHIVNVTSMNDTLPAPFGGWYSASKAALASASKVLDAEVRPFGISVSVVAPGFFRTEMAAALGEVEVPAASRYKTALESLKAMDAGRIETAGDPDDVAAAIELILTAAEPPSRVVVGADALSMVELVRDADEESFAQMLRDFVTQLNG